MQEPAENPASVCPGCFGTDCTSCGNHKSIEDEAFWQEFNSLFIQLVCLVEKKKLKCTYTTSDLRKAGKTVLCNGKQS